MLLAGLKLKALDSQSSRRSSAFSKIKKIKPHTFSNCHLELDLLVKVEGADYSISPMSDREKIVFNFLRAQEILNYEKSLLFEHIEDDDEVKKIIINRLKLPVDVTLEIIKRRINQGDIFKQGSTYEKVFNTLKDKKIKSNGYLWFGVRPIPIPKYYLSRSAMVLLKKY